MPGAVLVKRRTGPPAICPDYRMSATLQGHLKREDPGGIEGRRPSLHILFVHSHVAEVDRCLQELKRVHFTVNAEIVVTPEEFTERLSSQDYDLVLAEYSNADWREAQALELLHLVSPLTRLTRSRRIRTLSFTRVENHLDTL